MGLASIAKRIMLPAGIRTHVIRGGPLKGMRFGLDLQRSTQPWRGVYERPLQEWLVSHVRTGATCLDIGASDGYFTLLMAKLAGPSGKVFAFEPGVSAKQIGENVTRNSSLELAQVRVFEAMVGDAPVGNVNSVSIDQLVDDGTIAAPSLVKIDVDGGEVDVLESMEKALRRYHPSLFIEVHSEELLRRVTQVTDSHGYAMELKLPERHEYRPISFNAFYFSK